MKRKGIDEIMLYNYGVAVPQVYGIRSKWMPCGPVAGVFAISPNYIYGIDPFQHRQDCFTWLRGREPDARPGFSLFVFNISDTEAAKMIRKNKTVNK